MSCLFRDLTGGIKNPDSMNRKEKLQRIASFEVEMDAVSWWLKHGARISKAAFDRARGYDK